MDKAISDGIYYDLIHSKLTRKDIAEKWGVCESAVYNRAHKLKVDQSIKPALYLSLYKDAYWTSEEEIFESLNPTYQAEELEAEEKRLLSVPLPEKWKIINPNLHK